MGRFFDMENPVWQALSRATDIVILNLLFLLCSIPVITIGASLTAMSYVTLKMKDGEEGYIWKSFFRSFKQNFRQATVIWLIMAAVGVILYMDFQLALTFEGLPAAAMRVAVYAGVIVWVMVLLYVFPLLARFENTIGKTMQNALLLSVANAPRTLAVVALLAAALVVTFWNAYTITFGLFIWMVFGFALFSWINSSFQIKLFRSLAGQEDPEKVLKDDQWSVDKEEGEQP